MSAVILLWIIRRARIVPKINPVRSVQPDSNAIDDVGERRGLTRCDVDVARKVAIQYGDHGIGNIHDVHEVALKATIDATGALAGQKRHE